MNEKKYVLTKSQTLELFANILARFDSKKSLDKLNSAKLMKEVMLNKPEAELIARAIFGTYQVEKPKRIGKLDSPPEFEEKTEQPTFIYEMCLRIRQSEPYVITDSKYVTVKDWINEKRTPDNEFKLYTLQEAEVIGESGMLPLFEGTKWNIYHHEYLGDTNGIVRAVLHFQQFGKVEMYTKQIEKDFDQDCIGYYSIEDKHLRLHMKLKDTGKKNLNHLYFIGENKIDIAVGIYNNVGSAMYTGNVLIERKKEDDVDDRELIGYFPDGEGLPEHVKHFFSDYKSCMIIVPNTITDITSLKYALKLRDAQLEKNDKTVIRWRSM